MKHAKKILLGLVLLVVLSIGMGGSEKEHIYAASLTLNQVEASMLKGQNLQLDVAGKKKVTWKSSNTSIASVSKTGLVKAKAKGTVTITATSGKEKFYFKLTIEDANISTTELTMVVTQKKTIKVTGTKMPITWTSSNKKVATVNEKGQITAKKAGNTTITATISGKKFTCKVKVEAPYLSVTNPTIEVGEKLQMELLGTTLPVKWSIKNKNLASVDETGLITAKDIGDNVYPLMCNTGETVITATVNGIKYTTNITTKVTNPISTDLPFYVDSTSIKRLDLKVGVPVTFNVYSYQQGFTVNRENSEAYNSPYIAYSIGEWNGEYTQVTILPLCPTPSSGYGTYFGLINDRTGYYYGINVYITYDISFVCDEYYVFSGPNPENNFYLTETECYINCSSWSSDKYLIFKYTGTIVPEYTEDVTFCNVYISFYDEDNNFVVGGNTRFNQNYPKSTFSIPITIEEGGKYNYFKEGHTYRVVVENKYVD